MMPIWWNLSPWVMATTAVALGMTTMEWARQAAIWVLNATLLLSILILIVLPVHYRCVTHEMLPVIMIKLFILIASLSYLCCHRALSISVRHAGFSLALACAYVCALNVRAVYGCTDVRTGSLVQPSNPLPSRFIHVTCVQPLPSCVQP